VRVHANKRAIRALGIAESFRRSDRFSTFAGIVMRSDLVVDGFSFGRATVGGDDATSGLVGVWRALRRDDVNVILVSGAVVSYFNVVDVDTLSEKTGIPVVCLTYRESSGIEGSIRARFEDPHVKLASYARLGARVAIDLKTGRRVFARLASIGEDDARQVLDRFTLQGSVPEPVRVARLLARARHSSHPAD
jgi:hypothetical protein